MLLKSFFAAAAVLALVAPAAIAEDAGFGWENSAPVNGQQGDIRHNSAKTDTNNFYQQDASPGRRVDAPVHQTGITGTGGISNNSGGTGLLDGLLRTTSTGGVIPGTQISPANLAIMVEKHRPFGGQLPKTTLDSFVARSGYNDRIYGDEGTDGPPPYSSFGVIQQGGVSATTGHRNSGLPSAWY